MKDDGEAEPSLWSAGIEIALDELQRISRETDDTALDCMVTTVRDALDSWTALVGRRAYHERAVRDLDLREQGARRRIGMIVDLATHLCPGPLPGRSGNGRGFGEPIRGTAQPDTAHTPRLAAYLFGGFELQVAGRRVTDWRGRRGPAVLQYLIGHQNVPVDRAVLTEALWPGIGPDLGRHRLHQAVYALRQTLQNLDGDGQHILCEEGSYRLHPQVRIWIDVYEFEKLATAGQQHDASGEIDAAVNSYRAAETLYRGDYLENAPLAEWAEPDRVRLRSRYIAVAGRLGELLAGRGEHAEALAVTSAALNRDCWNESLTRRAMRAHVAMGNRSSALQLFARLEAELAEELDVAPSPETCRLVTEIRSPSVQTR